MGDKRNNPPLTSKYPPLLTKGMEHMTMTTMMHMRTTPVGLAHPGMRPKTWGLAVMIHS